jgi:uncharacterized protein
VSRRGALLLPVAAVAVHQLRYLLAFGGDAGALLAEQGHAYLHTLGPWLALACSALFGAALGRAARAGESPEPVAIARLWALAAGALVVIYAGQELLEGMLEPGHPAGLAGVLGEGGWLALPSAVLVAAVLAVALRGAQRVLARLARHRAALPRPHQAAAPPQVFLRPLGPLASAAAGRAPPRSRSTSTFESQPKGITMNRRKIALATAGATLALAPAAGAHVTVHPNVIPEGAFAVLDVRVPNETDDADTTKVQVQMPDGFAFVSADPPPGWTASFKREKLDEPIKTDDGEITEQVTQVTFSGGSIPPGQFREFPLSVGIPGKSGDTLTFKALQTYSNGDIVRWIGGPDADEPAPTVTISDEGGVIEDSTGEGSHHATATTKVVEKESSNGLAIAALIVGGLGLLAGGAALTRGRRS